MTAATFDTLKAAEALREAGIAEAHAIANAMRDAVAEGVATKTDIARLEAQIAASEQRMMLAMVAVAGTAVALVKPLA